MVARRGVLVRSVVLLLQAIQQIGHLVNIIEIKLGSRGFPPNSASKYPPAHSLLPSVQGPGSEPCQVVLRGAAQGACGERGHVLHAVPHRRLHALCTPQPRLAHREQAVIPFSLLRKSQASSIIRLTICCRKLRSVLPSCRSVLSKGGVHRLEHVLITAVIADTKHEIDFAECLRHSCQNLRACDSLVDALKLDLHIAFTIQDVNIEPKQKLLEK
mmetsp:Transcript_11296/g.28336  ORF Transcript_11296/g.28336 Transcript_11296/m.28336 type:complete len:215 (+) Transcript_11296:211-855(+)